jgi:superoxide dismutase, Cu-Zn family
MNVMYHTTTMGTETGGNANDPSAAMATVMGSPQYQQIGGRVTFTQMQEGVSVIAEIHGLPMTSTGFFAFHLHQGACGNPGTDASNYFPDVGGHYNPHDLPHPLHAGDFPPLIETGDGSAYLSFVTNRFTLENIIGRSVIIHLNPDDFKTQPSGNAGPKIACGVVTATHL